MIAGSSSVVASDPGQVGIWGSSAVAAALGHRHEPAPSFWQASVDVVAASREHAGPCGSPGTGSGDHGLQPRLTKVDCDRNPLRALIHLQLIILGGAYHY